MRLNHPAVIFAISSVVTVGVFVGVWAIRTLFDQQPTNVPVAETNRNATNTPRNSEPREPERVTLPQLPADELARYQQAWDAWQDEHERLAAEAVLFQADCRLLPTVERWLEQLRTAGVPETDARIGKLVDLYDYIDDFEYAVAKENGRGEIVHLPYLEADTETGVIKAAARAIGVRPGEPLELLVCTHKGKGHESVFTLTGLARDLAWIMRDVGGRTSSDRPRDQGDWYLYDGSTYEITASWQGFDGKEVTCRIEDIVVDSRNGRALPATGFAFTGSSSRGRMFLADELGLVVGLMSFPHAVLQNPWPNSQNDDSFRLSNELYPPGGAAVLLTLTPEDDELRYARIDSLRGDWQAYLPIRERKIRALDPTTYNTEPTKPPQVDRPRDLADKPRAVPAGVLPQLEAVLAGAEPQPRTIDLPPLPPALPADKLERVRLLIGLLRDQSYEVRRDSAEELGAMDCRAFQPMVDVRDALPPQAHVVRDLLNSAIVSVQMRPYVAGRTIYLPGLAFNQDTQSLLCEGMISQFDGEYPIEFVVCGPLGKTHESIVMMTTPASTLDFGLQLMKLKRSTLVPAFQADWMLFDGDSVVIEVEWGEGLAPFVPFPASMASMPWTAPAMRRARIESMIIDRATGEPPAPTGFIYTGSSMTRQGYLADFSGTIVSALTHPLSVLENPLTGAGVPDRFIPNLATLPPQGTPVRLRFSRENAEARAARDAELAPIWEEERARRPQIAFDPPEGWSFDPEMDPRMVAGVYHQFEPRLPRALVLYSEPNADDGALDFGDDFKEHVRIRNRARRGFKEIIEEHEVVLDGQPAWQVVMTWNDGGYSFVTVTRTELWDYHVLVTLEPGDLEEHRALTEMLLERVTVGLD